MKIKSLLLLSVIFLSVTMKSSAHSDRFGILSYTMGLSTGKTNEFISNTSFRGAALDYRSFANDNIAVGFSTAWSVFYEHRYNETFTKDGVSINANQFRYFNSIPIMLNGDYFFKHDGGTEPYIGLGIGTIWDEVTVDFGVYRYQVDAWHFAVSPEIGALIEIKDLTTLALSLKYNISFETNDVEKQSYLALNVGFLLN